MIGVCSTPAEFGAYTAKAIFFVWALVKGISLKSVPTFKPTSVARVHFIIIIIIIIITDTNRGLYYPPPPQNDLYAVKNSCSNA